jgi:hypothetical protein
VQSRSETIPSNVPLSTTGSTATSFSSVNWMASMPIAFGPIDHTVEAFLCARIALTLPLTFIIVFYLVSCDPNPITDRFFPLETRLRGSRFLFTRSPDRSYRWYGPRVGIVFSPADHHGIWAGRREGVKGKGTLPAYLQEVVERIAKEKD